MSRRSRARASVLCARNFYVFGAVRCVFLWFRGKHAKCYVKSRARARLHVLGVDETSTMWRRATSTSLITTTTTTTSGAPDQHQIVWNAPQRRRHRRRRRAKNARVCALRRCVRTCHAYTHAALFICIVIKGTTTTTTTTATLNDVVSRRQVKEKVNLRNAPKHQRAQQSSQLTQFSTKLYSRTQTTARHSIINCINAPLHRAVRLLRKLL